ncbi:MAG: hypothetical protein AB7G39_13965 [Alphaproteobacteria bacterium]
MRKLRARFMSSGTTLSLSLLVALTACGTARSADEAAENTKVATIECIRPAAAAVPAPKPSSEPMSIQVRRLQTRLMVAALSCDMRNDYNAFVTTYRPELTRHGTDLQAHFARNFGKSNQKQLNSFVTSLANEASAASLADHDGYCAEMAATFQQMKDGKAASIDSFFNSPVQVAFGGTFKSAAGEAAPQNCAAETTTASATAIR